jgi:hypothetical protein
VLIPSVGIPWWKPFLPVRLEVIDEGVEQHAEGVGDAVQNEVAHETGEDHDPAPAPVGGRRELDERYDDVIVVEGFALVAVRVNDAAEPAEPYSQHSIYFASYEWVQ